MVHKLSSCVDTLKVLLIWENIEASQSRQLILGRIDNDMFLRRGTWLNAEGSTTGLGAWVLSRAHGCKLQGRHDVTEGGIVRARSSGSWDCCE